jgi:dihydroorotate dehydrogenase (NAD+) catalytic subunit
MTDLSIELAGMRLKNPVLVASGTYGYGREYSGYYDPGLLGGIVIKGLSLMPQEGNPPPRILETPCGMLNSIGLANVGVQDFLENYLPSLQGLDTHIIANIYGKSLEEYVEVARALEGQQKISAIEVNISCPNVKKGGLLFGADPQAAFEVVEAIKRVYSRPLIAKLTPNVTDIVPIAKAVEQAGADAISLINTLRGMAVNIHTRRPILGAVFGGLSGPAIRPVAVYMVYCVKRSVSIPVIGMGGIMKPEDALEFFIVGASAIQVGTANFVDPYAPIKIIKGIQKYLIENNLNSIQDLIGTLRT